MRAGGRAGDGGGHATDHPIALVALGSAYGLDGRFDEAARILCRLLARARPAGLVDRASTLQVAGLLSLFLLALDRDDELDRLLAEAGAVADAAEARLGAAAPRPS